MLYLNTAVSQFATFIDGQFTSRNARFQRIPPAKRISVIVELLQVAGHVVQTKFTASEQVITEFSSKFGDIYPIAFRLHLQSIPELDHPSSNEATTSYRATVSNALLKVNLREVLDKFWSAWSCVHSAIDAGDLEIDGCDEHGLLNLKNMHESVE